jgi:co-chaperonin GroES (HSP10)
MMSFEAVKIKKISPLHDHIIVTDMNFDQRVMSSGIVLMSDDAKSQGIRPRWGQVYAVGPKQKDITVGQWICVAHGRWTRGISVQDHNGVHQIRRVDNDDILLVSDERPSDETLGVL